MTKRADACHTKHAMVNQLDREIARLIDHVAWLKSIRDTLADKELHFMYEQKDGDDGDNV